MEQFLSYAPSQIKNSIPITGLQKFHEELKELYSKRYQTAYGCLWACADNKTINDIVQEAEHKKALSPVAIIVIGIGGSYLGTKAVYEALYEYTDPHCPLLFVDTFDIKALHNAKEQIKKAALHQQNVMVIVVTKSGSTSETLVNFQVLWDSMQQAYPSSWNELIVIISDKNSHLTQWGQEKGCVTLSIPSLVGGRYSVFTAVGLFPLAMIGVDITELCAGAEQYTQQALLNNDNTSLTNAHFVYEHYEEGKHVYDLFLFDSNLESLGKWYRQLLAESLGKENKKNEKVTLIPSVSIGTLELHSVAQLMLGATPPVCTTFVTVQEIKNDIHLKKVADDFFKYEFTSVHTLMNQAAYATQKAYELVGLPYDIIMLPSVTPYYIGQFLQLYMMQVLYLAYLVEVNPFDQPHVEIYKTFMQRSEITP